METICGDCGRDFHYPSKLAQHQRRKTPCAPILEPEDLPAEALEDPDLDQKKCRFCGRVFSSYTSMRRHVRNTCKIAPNAKNGDAGMEVLYEHTIRRQAAQLEAQQAQITEMMGMMQRMEGMVLAAQGGGGGHNQQAGEVAIAGDANQVAVDNRKQVIVNVFGKEGLDHVTLERIKVILDESLARPALPEAANAAVMKTAMLVYSDPDHPENLTAYLPNKKTNDVLVHAEDGWEVQPAFLVLPPMAQKSVDTLFDRQPYEDAEDYGPLMKELAENEKRYTAGSELRPILVRNKDLLARALEALPVADGHFTR
jgi:hypothetical protein